MATQCPNGTRLSCARCGSEFIVLRSNDPVLDCCGEPMRPTFVPGSGSVEGRPDAR
jgi:hypothetical protein